MNKCFQNDKLKNAFNFLDKDKDGYISAEELEVLFGPVVDMPTLKKIIQEADIDKDNKVK